MGERGEGKVEKELMQREMWKHWWFFKRKPRVGGEHQKESVEVIIKLHETENLLTVPSPGQVSPEGKS